MKKFRYALLVGCYIFFDTLYKLQSQSIEELRRAEKMRKKAVSLGNIKVDVWNGRVMN